MAPAPPPCVVMVNTAPVPSPDKKFIYESTTFVNFLIVSSSFVVAVFNFATILSKTFLDNFAISLLFLELRPLLTAVSMVDLRLSDILFTLDFT